MRQEWPLATCIVLAASLVAGAQAPAANAAAKVLSDAREAMGGEAKHAAVKTIVATGQTRQVAGANLVPAEFEIDVELPDKYVRKDEIPIKEGPPASSGFNGDSLIQIPVAGAATPGRVSAVKQDFARLMLGMFAQTFSSYPLTFRLVGEAEAPEGRADVLDASGPGNFSVRLFINRETHLPIMESWTTTPGRGAADGTPPIETRLYFSEYRDSDGLQFPFRIRRGVGNDTVEETIFDRIRINAKIDPKKFAISK